MNEVEVEAEADTGAGMGGGGEGAAAAGGNNHNSNNNNAFNPFGGMPNGGIAGMNIPQPGQQPSPEQMLSMMQSLLDNPTMMSPQLQQMINSVATYSTNDAEGDADAERRRIVEQCMPHIPNNIIMNIEEYNNLMNMLYEVGMLSKYLADVDHPDLDEPMEFKDYFDFNNEDDIKIDPKTGKITFLRLEMENDVANNGVPSKIDQFQSLGGIYLQNCSLLTMELGNLPLLETITFFECTSTMFENVPEGLQLSSIKAVIINSDSNATFKYNLSSFLKIFSNTLEVLEFDFMKREDSDETLHVLQNDDLCFRHSLTTIKMRWCQLNEDDLKRLLFEILGRFPNLHTLDISCNNIESLSGIALDITGNNIESLSDIGDRIEQVPFIPNNKLRKLILNEQMNDFEIEAVTEALETLLDKVDGISNLGAYAYYHQKYEPKIEYKLRINLAGRKELMDRPIMNRALWPLILERAYSNSSEIYMYLRNGKDTVTINQEVESKKCASGLFYLLKNWKIVDGSSSSTTTTNITNDSSSEGSNINNNNSTRNE